MTTCAESCGAPLPCAVHTHQPIARNEDEQKSFRREWDQRVMLAARVVKDERRVVVPLNHVVRGVDREG